MLAALTLIDYQYLLLSHVRSLSLEREKGRKGEREKGRKGEREKGRKGEREKGRKEIFGKPSFSPSPILTHSAYK